MKALGLVHHGGGSARALRAHGVACTAGVLASFAVLAGVLATVAASPCTAPFMAPRSGSR